MRKILTFLFAALMSVGMWAIPAPTCGDGLTWEMNAGVLTISYDGVGTGVMYDYDENPAPWYNSAGSITSVIIPNGVTHIGKYAFNQCTGLTSITIPNSVTSIGGSAFAGCTGLTSITIPNSVTSIGNNAFIDCTGLTSMVVASGNTKYDSRDNCNAIIETSSNTLIAGFQNTIIPNSVTSIGGCAFCGCTGLTSIEIPNSVISIGESAFQNCSGLTSVTIGNSVTSIGNFAFTFCTGLTSVTNYAVTPQTINSFVFFFVNMSSCTLYVPAESVSAYSDASVWQDFGTKSAIPAPTPAWVLEGDEWDDATKTLTVNSNPGYQAYANNTEIEHVIINNSVDSIDTRAFMNCSNLESVTIPSSVASIGGVAFGGCTALTSIEIPNGVEYIAEQAFAYCIALTSIEIPNSVKYIEEQAFAMCSLISIEIPNSVDSIGVGAFYGCTGLTSVTIPNSVKYIEAYAFAGCEGLTSVTIPNSVEYIGAEAFVGCTAVTDVYCYPNAADLTWEEEGCDDFKESKATECHVPSNYYAEYLAKFGATVNVTFVGDLPASDFAITANEDPQNASVYYSTFYESANKYELPDGVEAYVATISGDALTLTKIAEAGQVIPADNAVILKSTVTPFTLTPSEADAVTFSATNSLQGVDADTEISAKVTGTCYVLSGTQAEGVGFFQYEAPNLLKAYKAFVDRPNGASGAPRRMPFIFDAATGVENVQGNVQSTKVLRDGQLIIIRNGVEYNANGMMVK